MPTAREYALLAGAAYTSTRSELNQIREPQGWTPFWPPALYAKLLDMGFTVEANSILHRGSGFEARVFSNGSEAVISFAGTNPVSADDWSNNVGLFVGSYTEQFERAALVYAAVKQVSSQPITFTGHSLGGGLASLMGVYFDEAAVTFDQAPFRAAAIANHAGALQKALNRWDLGTNADLATYVAFQTPGGTVLRGESGVRTVYVEGEFLSVPASMAMRIGQQPEKIDLDDAAVASVSSLTELHAQQLLILAQYSQASGAFRERIAGIPSLLPSLFDGRYFSRAATDRRDPAILEHLVRHEFGVPGQPYSAGDGMFTSFVNELGVLTEPGVMQHTAINETADALEKRLQQAMNVVLQQNYYSIRDAFSPSQTLFKAAAGGWYMDVSQATGGGTTKDLVAGRLLSDAIFDTYAGDGGTALYASPTFRQFDRLHWQAGTGSFSAVGVGSMADLMLGGAGGDTLEGGEGTDLLLGGGAEDTLDGGAGADTLIGGAGTDTYSFSGNFGHDRIVDDDGILRIDGQPLPAAYGFGGNVWITEDGVWTFAFAPSTAGATVGTLSILKTGSDATITVENFSRGKYGLQLLDVTPALPPAPPATAYPIFGDLDPIEHQEVRNAGDTDPSWTIVGATPVVVDAEGRWLVVKYTYNLLTQFGHPNPADSTPLLGSNDTFEDSPLNDSISTGGGNDLVALLNGGDAVADLGSGDDDMRAFANAPLGRYYGDGGTGSDYLGGGRLNDVFVGGEGPDALYGSSGDDFLFGANQGGNSALIAAGETQTPSDVRGEWIDAENGDDQAFGDAGRDLIAGGDGNDLLVGAGGDDVIYGDLNTVSPADADWRAWQVVERVTHDAASRTFHYDFQQVQTEDTLGIGDDIIYAGAGDDVAFGEGGRDLIEGGAGADKLWGDAGNDTIYGGADEDILSGDNSLNQAPAEAHGNDFIDGGAGNDEITGWGGSDVLLGGDGADVIDGDASAVLPPAFHGDDLLFGGAGDDLLVGRGGSDQLDGGDGDDELQGDTNDPLMPTIAHGSDLLDGGAGIDRLFGQGGDDTLIGGLGDDRLSGDASKDELTENAHGRDYLDAGAGDDVAFGGGASDALYGGEGNDLLWGDGEEFYVGGAFHGDDFLAGEDGADQLIGGGGSDVLVGGAGDDTILGDDSQDRVDQPFHGQDELDGGDGVDFLAGGGGADTLLGGDGDDILWGDDTVARVAGEAHGADYVDGEGGDDTLVGGGGADFLLGGAGADVIVGDGPESGGDAALAAGFQGNDYADGGADNDRIFGFGGDDTLLGDDGDDIVLGDASLAELSALSHGADVLDGGAGNDVLIGGGGVDAIYGGNGDDIIAGDFRDTLLDLQGHDLLDGGAGADSIDGEGGDDRILGGDGDDRLYGGNGSDTLDGGAGDDHLEGGDGGDQYTFAAGFGRDEIVELPSSTGLDTLRFSELHRPDVALIRIGTDLLVVSEGGIDEVAVRDQFGAGTTAVERVIFADGTTFSSAEIAALAASLVLGSINGDRIAGSTGADYMQGGVGDDIYVVNHALDTVFERPGEGTDTIEAWVDVVLPADVESLVLVGSSPLTGTGNQVDNWLTGNTWSNTLSGADGNDFLSGRGGNDTYIGGRGNDYIASNTFSNDSYRFALGDGIDTVTDSGGSDTILFDASVSPADVELKRWGSRLEVRVGSTERLHFLDMFRPDRTVRPEYAVEWVRFSDGTAWDSAEILRRVALNDPPPSEGDDVLVGSDERDVIDALGGNDIVDGLAGSDSLSGGSGSDTLLGGTGNDVLDGGTDADHMDGGAGSDVYVVDHANDVVVETLEAGVNSTDEIQAYVDYVLPENVERLTLFGLAAQSGTGNALDNVIRGNSQANVLQGLTGNDRLSGGDGDDTLVGGDGDDSLDGMAGADTLVGGTGDDTYDLAAGDVIVEASRSGNDTIRTYAGIGVVLDLGAYQNVENITVSADSGTAYIAGDAADNILQVNDAWGSSTRAVGMHGGDGNDSLIAGAGRSDDDLNGGAGDDYLQIAAGGNDTLTGGSGNDVLRVLSGSLTSAYMLRVTYRFGDGFGNDEIIHGPVHTNTGWWGDTGSWLRGAVELGGSSDPSSIRFERQDDDLVLYQGASDSIRVLNHFQSFDDAGEQGALVSNWQLAPSLRWMTAREIEMAVDQTSLASGTTGDDLLIAPLTGGAVYGAEGDDLIIGQNGLDVLSGGSGNDALEGGSGDVFEAGSGNDSVLVQFSPSMPYSTGTFTTYKYAQGDGEDTVTNHDGGMDRVQFGAGISASAVTVEVSGEDMLIRTGVGDSLRFRAVFQYDRVVPDFAPERIEFASGETWTLEDLLSRVANLGLRGTNTGDNLIGTTASDVIFGFAGNDVLNGGDGSDVLIGGAGNDTLTGGLGGDYFVGGQGDDTFVLERGDWPSDRVIIELEGEGVDTVQSSDYYTLAPNVENLTLIGNRGSGGTGNALNNVLTGDGSANSLAGLDGNDMLDGRGGADDLRGGAGNDVYVVDNVRDYILEDANAGIDRVQASISYVLGSDLENLTLSGTGAINGTGNALDNVLIGNSGANTLTGGAGNDRLDGGTGTDILRGGLGDDTYVLNASTGKTLAETAGEGTDTVESSVTHTLLANFEHLTLTGTGLINGTGNTANNYLRGNSNNNTLNGSGGNDVLQGGLGNDTLADTSGRGVHDGGDGTDTLTGGTDRQFFAGGLGADTITLGGGADLVAFNRGHGADTIAVPTSASGQGESNDTVSLSGIRTSELRLARSGSDLIIKVAGTADSIKLSGWYTAAGNKTVSTLQLIVDSTADYDAASADPLLSKRVARLNFGALVTSFDAAFAANPAVGDWAIPAATLATASLGGSDTDALGGQLAYRYGRDGNLAAVDFATASTMLADAGFGTAVQSIGSGATSGGVRLMMAARSAATDGEIIGVQSDVPATATADAFAASDPVTSGRGFRWLDRAVTDIWRSRLGDWLPAGAALADDAVISRRLPSASKSTATAAAPSEYERGLMLDDSATPTAPAAATDDAAPEIVLCEVGDDASTAANGASEQHVRAVPYLSRAALQEALDARPLAVAAGWAKFAREVDVTDSTALRWRAVDRAMENDHLLGGESEASEPARSQARALFASGTTAERRSAWRRALQA